MLTSVILEQNVLQKWNILFCGLYIAGYYNAQAAKFEVSEEDAAKGASVNATTGEFTWQNDGVALTANKTINVKVTVTYTWGVAVGTIPVTVKSNL